MTLTAIVNCDLYTPDEQIPQGLVLVEGSRIRAVGLSHEIPLPVQARLLDAQGGRVTPGLIDLGGPPSINNQMAARGITSCFDNSGSAQWGLPEDSSTEPDRYHLAPLDHIRSADPSVLRILLSSHRLILIGSQVQPLSTRSIRGLMALAETDFASALSAATVAPASFLDVALGRLAVDTPANLICWTRHGDLAWTMVNGEIAYP